MNYAAAMAREEVRGLSEPQLAILGAVLMVVFPPAGAAVGVWFATRQPVRAFGLMVSSAMFLGAYVYLITRTLAG